MSGLVGQRSMLHVTLVNLAVSAAAPQDEKHSQNVIFTLKQFSVIDVSIYAVAEKDLVQHE